MVSNVFQKLLNIIIQTFCYKLEFHMKISSLKHTNDVTLITFYFIS